MECVEGELRRQLGKPGSGPGRSQSRFDSQPVSAISVWLRHDRPGPHHDPIGLVHGWDQQYARRCGAVARSARRHPRDDLGLPRRSWFLYDAVRPQRIPGPSAHLAVPLQPWALPGISGALALDNYDNIGTVGGPSRPGSSPPNPGSFCDSQPGQGLGCNDQIVLGGYAATRSRHPGGVECLFGDGAAHFIKNSINGPTWIQLGSINGGEVISSDQY